MRTLAPVLLAVLALLPAAPVAAEPTRVDVRVISKGAKFIGTSIGGVAVEIRDADSGELLARGRTAGTTGDTARIMRHAQRHHDPVATDDAAVFRAEVDLTEPRRVEIGVRGPLAQPQAIQSARVTQWLLPGKHVTGGDGVRLELPGFVVDVLDPPAHRRLAAETRTFEVRANVTLMCGCPVEPGGLWDADRYEMTALVRRDGGPSVRRPLRYAGTISQFSTSIELDGPGTYDVLVYAFDPATGNAGLDRTTVIVDPK